jgi:YesN/AraC family two-component response regulator
MLVALEADVDDFLTKPLDVGELQARLRSGERLLALQENLLRAQEALRYQATHDHLTGLWNRVMVLEQLGVEITRAAIPLVMPSCAKQRCASDMHCARTIRSADTVVRSFSSCCLAVIPMLLSSSRSAPGPVSPHRCVSATSIFR